MTPITVASRTTSNAIPKWQPATWEDYLAYCDDPNLDGKYQQCEYSVALEGLQILLLEQTLAQLNQGTNVSAALFPV